MSTQQVPLADSEIFDLLQQIIQDQKYAPVLDVFYQAYEFRSQVEWLQESGLHGREGLSFAFEKAFSTYLVDPSWDILYSARVDIDNQLRETLKQAVTTLQSENFSFERFLWVLERKRVDVNDPEWVTIHICLALIQYWKRRESGTSTPDPW